MCGRFYIDDETEDESGAEERTVDVFPSQPAAALCKVENGVASQRMLWGFPRFDGKGIIINARAESALERKSFRDSMKYRRCVIPARGFYEWNKSKEKFSFERQDSRRLFMAGCYNLFKNEMHFVILTTSANLSVAPVHDRMPLILEADELEQWILDDGAAVQMLHKIPAMVKMRADYEQMNLF